MENNLPSKYLIKNINGMLESSLIIENDQLINIIIAISSSDDKKMPIEKVQKLTNMDSKLFSKSIDILEKSNYIDITMEDIEGASLHKVCRLTDKGEKILKMLEID